MDLSFNKGNYDQHMNMVNASKELLNDSIVLRSIKENVDKQIDQERSEPANDQDWILISILALPLFLIVVYINFKLGLSWRLIPGLGLIGFILVYFKLSRDLKADPSTTALNLHDAGPKPLKFLEMKVNYLLSLRNQKESQLQLLRSFYIIFFPFLLYFLYELLIKATPFDQIFIGIIAAYAISSIAWYFFFQNDFKALSYSKKQLEDYNKLIHQHYMSYADQEE